MPAALAKQWRLHVAEAPWHEEAQPDRLQQLVAHTVEHHSGPALLPTSYYACGGSSEADTWLQVSDARGPVVSTDDMGWGEGRAQMIADTIEWHMHGQLTMYVGFATTSCEVRMCNGHLAVGIGHTCY